MRQNLFNFKPLESSEMSPRLLVLSLLNVAFDNHRGIGDLIASGRLFGFEEATLRMAVTRLCKEGLVSSPSRGVYEIGPEAKVLNEEIRGWRDASTKRKPWNGDWIAIHTAHLGRTNRKQLRAREQALKLNGFAALAGGLYVRPNNLILDTDNLHEKMVGLGLDEAALVLNIDGYIDPTDRHWTSLWPSKTLEKTYRAATKEMNRSRTAALKMTIEDAAKETLLVGQSVIRTINIDPLLPSEIIDTDLFDEMVSTMTAYNELGVSIWREFYGER